MGNNSRGPPKSTKYREAIETIIRKQFVEREVDRQNGDDFSWPSWKVFTEIVQELSHSKESISPPSLRKEVHDVLTEQIIAGEIPPEFLKFSENTSNLDLASNVQHCLFAKQSQSDPNLKEATLNIMRDQLSDWEQARDNGLLPFRFMSAKEITAKVSDKCHSDDPRERLALNRGKLDVSLSPARTSVKDAIKLMDASGEIPDDFLGVVHPQNSEDRFDFLYKIMLPIKSEPIPGIIESHQQDLREYFRNWEEGRANGTRFECLTQENFVEKLNQRICEGKINSPRLLKRETLQTYTNPALTDMLQKGEVPPAFLQFPVGEDGEALKSKESALREKLFPTKDKDPTLLNAIANLYREHFTAMLAAEQKGEGYTFPTLEEDARTLTERCRAPGAPALAQGRLEVTRYLVQTYLPGVLKDLAERGEIPPELFKGQVPDTIDAEVEGAYKLIHPEMRGKHPELVRALEDIMREECRRIAETGIVTPKTRDEWADILRDWVSTKPYLWREGRGTISADLIYSYLPSVLEELAANGNLPPQLLGGREPISAEQAAEWAYRALVPIKEKDSAVMQAIQDYYEPLLHQVHDARQQGTECTLPYFTEAARDITEQLRVQGFDLTKFTREGEHVISLDLLRSYLPDALENLLNEGKVLPEIFSSNAPASGSEKVEALYKMLNTYYVGDETRAQIYQLLRVRSPAALNLQQITEKLREEGNGVSYETIRLIAFKEYPTDEEFAARFPKEAEGELGKATHVAVEGIFKAACAEQGLPWYSEVKVVPPDARWHYVRPDGTISLAPGEFERLLDEAGARGVPLREELHLDPEVVARVREIRADLLAGIYQKDTGEKVGKYAYKPPGRLDLERIVLVTATKFWYADGRVALPPGGEPNARVIKAEVLADLVNISPEGRSALAEALANSERGDIAAQRALAERLGLAKENDTERYYAEQGKEVPDFDHVQEDANQVPNRVITDYLPKNLDRTSETPAQPSESNSGENLKC